MSLLLAYGPRIKDLGDRSGGAPRSRLNASLHAGAPPPGVGQRTIAHPMNSAYTQEMYNAHVIHSLPTDSPAVSALSWTTMVTSTPANLWPASSLRVTLPGLATLGSEAPSTLFVGLAIIWIVVTQLRGGTECRGTCRGLSGSPRNTGFLALCLGTESGSPMHYPGDVDGRLGRALCQSKPRFPHRSRRSINAFLEGEERPSPCKLLETGLGPPFCHSSNP